MSVVNVEVSACVDCPHVRRTGAALAGSKYGKFLTVGIIVVRYTKFGFDSVACMLKHVTVDCGHVFMKTARSG